MKRNISKHFSALLSVKMPLMAAAAFLLVSCGAQVGGYSESDGVYYNPETDTLPENVIVRDDENQVGDIYNYNSSVIRNSDQNIRHRKNRYDDWNDATDSDWGTYAGNTVNYYDNWSYSPWGYSPYFYGAGWNLGFSFGWGYPYYGWYGYSPYYYGYSPYYFGYSSWWGWPYSYGYYSPYYYGYTPYYGYGGYYVPYKRSNADGRFYNSYNGGGGFNRTGNGNKTAFRNNASAGLRQNNTIGMRTESGMAPRNGMTGGFRNPGYNNAATGQPRNYTPRYNGQAPRSYAPREGQYQQPRQPREYSQPHEYSQPRSFDGGGFRSGGGFNSGGGGFRSGGGMGSGGMRSGGGR